MKKLLLLTLCVATSSAFATRTRLRSLSQDANGSYYLMDTRNMFLNPAQISNIKDHMNFEWGKSERPGTNGTVPEAEGGFAMNLGPGKLGVQLGRVTEFNQLIREINANLTDVTTNVMGGTMGEGQNNVDIMYGGGGNLKWGGGMAITRSKTATGNPSRGKEEMVQNVELRGGVATEKFEAFGSLLVGGQNQTDMTTTTAKFDETIGIRAGGGVSLNNEFRLFGHAGYDKFKASRSNNSVDYDGTRVNVVAGAAYVRSLENNARSFASSELTYLDVKATDSKGLPDEKYNAFAMPVILGVEADANAWARLRTSVRQNFLIGSTKTTTGNTADDVNYWENSPNNTAVSFGAGVSLNKFNFDAALVKSLTDNVDRAEASMTYLF